ncbi:Desosaminyl transferase EryCIII precursor [Pseudovibrio axinellae]|uniref:Desosaminyl transferase EryCIII n=1 Tax=Pseudovibrio axinellae TaxID=989403 RepID=A0A161XHZ8_9HYPH|nr:glycosyltransferase [Pseudovibrio axinellae]KZL21563.1 Desosaminyl transferase EryCIII precursor [Pseudovibrio axinellae]SER09698.1 sterol 3beta-glucosyltransferase [Pseudovibrio axinellae]
MSQYAKILIFTYGSRGDVEPFIALACGLAARGHEVTISTAAKYGDWIKEFNLAFQPLSNDTIDLIDTPDGKAAIEGSSGFFKRIAAGARLARKSGPLNSALNIDAWHAAQAVTPDLIVYHPKMIAAPHIAEALKLPAVMGLLQPMIVPTSEFPAAGLPNLPLPGYNRLGYELIKLSYSGFRKSTNHFRTQTLKLAPIQRRSEVLFPPTLTPIKTLHAISPWVTPQPKDWPNTAIMSGYWSLKSDESYKPPANLTRFLQAGPAPVYIGFGSMTVANPQALQATVVQALQKAKVRGVISAGWAGFQTVDSDNILTIKDVPHEWLFPKMAAVVHHGGMGTTAQGFRAGVPCVLCPFFGDQPFWAQKSVALGVGATPVPRKALTAERLANSIQVAVTDPLLKQNAHTLAQHLKNEDGVGVAVTQIENEVARVNKPR